jgi:hypothetical protein
MYNRVISKGKELFKKTIYYDNYLQVIHGAANIKISKKSIPQIRCDNS